VPVDTFKLGFQTKQTILIKQKNWRFTPEFFVAEKTSG
jgi:hypothetical protein